MLKLYIYSFFKAAKWALFPTGKKSAKKRRKLFYEMGPDTQLHTTDGKY
jgi:hypothetical protein